MNGDRLPRATVALFVLTVFAVFALLVFVLVTDLPTDRADVREAERVEHR